MKLIRLWPRAQRWNGMSIMIECEIDIIITSTLVNWKIRLRNNFKISGRENYLVNYSYN